MFNVTDARLGNCLCAEGIKPKVLGYAWIEAAEREYTYVSLSRRYKNFSVVFKAILFRMLWMAGITEPRKFATDEDIAYIVSEY